MIDTHAVRQAMREYWEEAEIYTMTPMQMVRHFAKAMEQPLDVPVAANETLEDMRWGLIREEMEELRDSIFMRDSDADILKEMCDLVYVLYGYAATFGWDMDEALRRVHKSNMSKVGPNGPIKREDGKVLKASTYRKPDLSDLV